MQFLIVFRLNIFLAKLRHHRLLRLQVVGGAGDTVENLVAVAVVEVGFGLQIPLVRIPKIVTTGLHLLNHINRIMEMETLYGTTIRM